MATTTPIPVTVELDVQSPPAHAALPIGLGSKVTLSGIVAAFSAFVASAIDTGLTNSATITYAVSALALVATFFAGRSSQAKAAIQTAAVIRSTASPYIDQMFRELEENGFDFDNEGPFDPVAATEVPPPPDANEDGGNVGPDGKPLM